MDNKTPTKLYRPGAKRPAGQTTTKVKALTEQGMTRNEIAAALGVSTQAVHYHLHKLLREQASERKAS